MIKYSEGQKAGLKAFLKNKYWKRKFENAPSENAKLYYAEQFSYSKGLSEGDEHTKIVIGIFIAVNFVIPLLFWLLETLFYRIF